ncbi:hypothetical protein [Lysobacter enzymogenes]|uniref:hypothetical protein n=1 Tax=Lysobacter enzymogenes TaxID=69 RepID=UPI001A958AF2|nr:hypothetical protein [Lysobacter enzymogenes]QQP96468.1 hypothetical protein JHW38_25280 [Lysobacter enzymogenes]QQP96502.1 hypothetical protein JHW38_00130 [Lysobacter enzymogenes]
MNKQHLEAAFAKCALYAAEAQARGDQLSQSQWGDLAITLAKALKDCDEPSDIGPVEIQEAIACLDKKENERVCH